jgi:S1-C subfamily serine protease
MSKYSTHYGTIGEDMVGGSGILLKDGLILSCYHVLDGYQAGHIKIMRFTKESTEIREGNQISIVAFDQAQDLLLLQTNPSFSGSYSEVAQVRPPTGAEIIITGHTQLRVTNFRLYHYIEGSLGILVTPVFFGDSGGGVFNHQGELLGIIKMVLVINGPVQTNTLYGYAIPLHIIQEFLNGRPHNLKG